MQPYYYPHDAMIHKRGICSRNVSVCESMIRYCIKTT